MKSILIIGGRGTLGTYLRFRLGSAFTIYEFSEKVSSSNPNFEKLLDLIRRHNINWVINAAGATNVDYCESNHEYAFEGNTLVPQIISTLQNEQEDNLHVINFSTDQVYSGLGDCSESFVDPQNEYGRSKLKGEKFLSRNVCTLRVNYTAKGGKRKSFSDWIVETAISKKHVQIYSDVYFNPVDLSVLGNCVEKVIAEEMTGTFNIGSQQKVSKSEFYLKLTNTLAISNPNLEFVRYAEVGKVPRPLDMSMNIAKAEKFGFNLPSLTGVIKNLAMEYKNEHKA